MGKLALEQQHKSRLIETHSYLQQEVMTSAGLTVTEAMPRQRRADEFFSSFLAVASI
jgi:hypothetical protein